MKKYSFLVYHREYQDFLEKIRDIGVLHIIEKEQNVSDEVRDQYQLINHLGKTIKSLSKRDVTKEETPDITDGLKIHEEVNNLYQRQDEIQQKLTQLEKEYQKAKPWGEFSADLIGKLRNEGIRVHLYTCASRKFDANWKEQYPLEIISESDNNIYFTLVTRNDESADIDAEEVKLPEQTASTLNKQKKEFQAESVSVNKKLDHFAATAIPSLERAWLELNQHVDFDKVIENTRHRADNKLMVLEGWVPNEKIEELNDFLEKEQVLYLVNEPDKNDKVPVLLRNNKFSKKFEPLGELYSLPSYKELDLTPFYAPFYMLFFGFCLGDVGYGVLMVVVSLLVKNKVEKSLRKIVSMITYLGLSTILFGIISGTVFGIPLYETDLPVYSTLHEKFQAQGTDINNILFYLSLMLGGIQIIFGMCLKAANEIVQMGWKYALSTFGWILLLLGGITLYGLNYAGVYSKEQITIPLYVLLAVSGILILFLNNPEKNILINLGSGLWNTYNMITGVLGDLLSYIRLFALGISTAILGYVFNSLAVQMSGDIPVLNIIIMVIILVIGHSINLFMSGLGSFVHPMRLTFVEFYKNADFTGGGKKYNPFRRKI
ncbi:MAG TPA: V-type ATPase 116kDa subunit family protein [Bacteroidales bacterium]|nr:V-type ATPase 116kDa subunit family protein [Bacteroidales bacterium]